MDQFQTVKKSLSVAPTTLEPAWWAFEFRHEGKWVSCASQAKPTPHDDMQNIHPLFTTPPDAAAIIAKEREVKETAMAHGAQCEAIIAARDARIDELEDKLIECRGSVRLDWQNYERLLMNDKLATSREAMQDEAKRLHDLLYFIETIVENQP